MTRSTVALVLLLASSGVAGADGRHVPPAEAVAGAAIDLVADAPVVGDAPMLHYRPAGAIRWSEVALTRRPDDRWVASIPPTAATPPAIEYYIDRGATPLFASSVTPHAVVVRPADSVRRRADDLARVGGRRSRVHVAGEWVDFGDNRVGEMTLADSYYRIDADFAYRLLTYPLEEIRVGYTRLIGTTTRCDPTCSEVEAGYKVGGWFELGLGLIDGIHADARLLVVATTTGFTVGGRGELRIGPRDGSHVAVGGEMSADVGGTGFFRLGWDTVPRIAMSATVEASNLPSTDRPIGVRLIYDVAVPIRPGVRATARAGYAARDQRIGGFTAGLGAIFDF